MRSSYVSPSVIAMMRIIASREFCLLPALNYQLPPSSQSMIQLRADLNHICSCFQLTTDGANTYSCAIYFIFTEICNSSIPDSLAQLALEPSITS